MEKNDAASEEAESTNSTLSEKLQVNENNELDESTAELLDDEDVSSSLESMVRSAMYAGPLPPPQMLLQYEEVLPGMADRIMTMAENEQGIRARDNGWLVFNDFSRVLGSVIVSLGLVGGAIYCAVIGQPAVAIALAASGLVPQIVKFFNQKKDH